MNVVKREEVIGIVVRIEDKELSDLSGFRNKPRISELRASQGNPLPPTHILAKIPKSFAKTGAIGV
jgi:hypothetical protein